MNANLEITAQQHEDFLRRVWNTANAELMGWLDAKNFGKHGPGFYASPALKAAYVQGFDSYLAKQIQDKAGQPA